VKGPGEIHLDGAKAIRAAAGVGLAVLGLSLLPGLLRAPEPEPLPADVGFRPTENLVTTPLPVTTPAGSLDPGSTLLEKADPGSKEGRPVERARAGRAGRADDPRRDSDRRRKGRSSDRPTSPGTEPVETPPAPVASPPPVTIPTPPPPPAPAVGDGSVEFAPR
jgi:hypothetical protein